MVRPLTMMIIDYQKDEDTKRHTDFYLADSKAKRKAIVSLSSLFTFFSQPHTLIHIRIKLYIHIWQTNIASWLAFTSLSPPQSLIHYGDSLFSLNVHVYCLLKPRQIQNIYVLSFVCFFKKIYTPILLVFILYSRPSIFAYDTTPEARTYNLFFTYLD